MADASASNETGERLVSVCGYLLSFLEDGTWSPENALESLVLGTLSRGRGTFISIVNLLIDEQPLQAAMLSRSLFEDMVVAHWLVLHEASSEWLVDRFHDHAKAMRLHEFEVRAAMGLSYPDENVDDLLPEAERLRKKFGKFAQKDWWGVDADESPVSMPDVVERLADSQRFQPRLKGEQPILRQYYALQHKLWSQALHHTAAGTSVERDDSDSVPLPKVPTSPALILAANYWVFGQLIYVALELATAQDVQEYFDELFVAGMAVFAAEFGVDPAVLDDLEARFVQRFGSH